MSVVLVVLVVLAVLGVLAVLAVIAVLVVLVVLGVLGLLAVLGLLGSHVLCLAKVAQLQVSFLCLPVWLCLAMHISLLKYILYVKARCMFSSIITYTCIHFVRRIFTHMCMQRGERQKNNIHV